MTQTEKSSNRMAETAELIRQGATLLQEGCPRCGAVQIKFQGEIYCTREDDLRSVLSRKSPQEKVEHHARKDAENRLEGSQQSSSSPSLQRLLEEKLDTASKQLESTTDVQEQSKLLDLISKYLETLEKLKKSTG